MTTSSRRRASRRVWRDGETLEQHDARRRPWRVHVREIGPNYSYGSAARAVERAYALLEDGYATVDVWECHLDSSRLWPMIRTVYRSLGPSRLPHATVEHFGPETGYRWLEVSPSPVEGTVP